MTLADEATSAGLHKVGGRPPFGSYLRQVWERREFIYALARFRVEAENGRNRLGMAWVILKPLLNAGVYGLIFGLILSTHKGVDDFVPFLVIGALMIEYFSTCLTMGAKSITSNAALVQSLSFPRMALPLALVTQRLLMFVPTIGVMLLVALAWGNHPTWEWLLMIPVAITFTIFNAGVTLITARLTVHFRDMTQLLPFISRFIFYSTGVFFSFEERFKDHPKALEIVAFQPLHEFLTLGRTIFLGGPQYEVKPEFFLYSTVWAIVILAVGARFFWAAEERYGRTD